MKRIMTTPRADYRDAIEALGFDYHMDYWKEDAYYELSETEVEKLETATTEAYRMYCETADYLIEQQPDKLERMLDLTPEIVELIRNSWEADELSLYGRFDFMFDKQGTPRILEFNADTPTSLLEAAVIQWQWKEACFPKADQYNGIHEGLVQSWEDMFEKGSILHLAGALDNAEDVGNLQYLASTAREAGLSTRVIDINALNLQDGVFYDPSGEKVERCFKLYPWEWMVDESPDGCMADVQWVEPVWKLVMSNKAILTTLFELSRILHMCFRHSCRVRRTVSTARNLSMPAKDTTSVCWISGTGRNGYWFRKQKVIIIGEPISISNMWSLPCMMAVIRLSVLGLSVGKRVESVSVKTVRKLLITCRLLSLI